MAMLDRLTPSADGNGNGDGISGLDLVAARGAMVVHVSSHTHTTHPRPSLRSQPPTTPTTNDNEKATMGNNLSWRYDRARSGLLVQNNGTASGQKSGTANSSSSSSTRVLLVIGGSLPLPGVTDMEIDDVIGVDMAPVQRLGLAPAPGLGSRQGEAPGPGQGLSEGKGEVGLSLVVLVSGRWHGEMDLSTRGVDDQEGVEAVVVCSDGASDCGGDEDEDDHSVGSEEGDGHRRSVHTTIFDHMYSTVWICPLTNPLTICCQPFNYLLPTLLTRGIRYQPC